MEKTCSRCKETKPLKEFRVRWNERLYRTPLSKRMGECKKCERWYWTNGPNRRWNHLRGNLRRHEGGNVTATELRDILGPPSKCYLCGDPLSWEISELDHYVPLSKGGATEINNLRWAHRQCNRMKHDLSPSEFLALLHKIASHLSQ